MTMLKVEAHKQKPAGVINSGEYFESVDQCLDNLNEEFKKITEGKPEKKEESKAPLRR